MGKVVIKEEACKSCGLCVAACPKKILEIDNSKINGKGYNPCRMTDEDSCIACAFCATICPDVVIEVYK